MSQVEFVGGLPRSNGHKYDWDSITAELKQQPGEWAIVEGKGVAGTKGAAGVAARSLRRGEVAGAKPGEFESTVRGTTIYARYVGH